MLGYLSSDYSPCILNISCFLFLSDLNTVVWQLSHVPRSSSSLRHHASNSPLYSLNHHRQQPKTRHHKRQQLRIPYLRILYSRILQFRSQHTHTSPLYPHKYQNGCQHPHTRVLHPRTQQTKGQQLQTKNQQLRGQHPQARVITTSISKSRTSLPSPGPNNLGVSNPSQGTRNPQARTPR